MSYTCVLRCAERNLYVGSARDLKRRIVQHDAGRVPAYGTSQACYLEYYEAYRSELSAKVREE